MKKALVFLLLSTLVFSSCIGVPPGFKDIEVSNSSLIPTISEESSSTDFVYVVNLSSRKYHLSSCEYAKSISVKNRYETGDIYYIMSMEFIPCSICDPDRK